MFRLFLVVVVIVFWFVLSTKANFLLFLEFWHYYDNEKMIYGGKDGFNLVI